MDEKPRPLRLNDESAGQRVSHSRWVWNLRHAPLSTSISTLSLFILAAGGVMVGWEGRPARPSVHPAVTEKQLISETLTIVQTIPWSRLSCSCHHVRFSGLPRATGDQSQGGGTGAITGPRHRAMRQRFDSAVLSNRRVVASWTIPNLFLDFGAYQWRSRGCVATGRLLDNELRPLDRGLHSTLAPTLPPDLLVPLPVSLYGMWSLSLSEALLLFCLLDSASRVAAQLVGGQFFTSGLVILNSPQPGSTIQGELLVQRSLAQIRSTHAPSKVGQKLSLSLDVSGDGLIPTPNAAVATTLLNLDIFLVSGTASVNFSLSQGAGLLSQEPGSTVKHLDVDLPDCLPAASYNVAHPRVPNMTSSSDTWTLVDVLRAVADQQPALLHDRLGPRHPLPRLLPLR